MAAFRAAHAAGRDVAVRTGGTTGSPRQLVRSTASWVDSFGHVSALSGIEAGARVWVPGPVAATMNLFARVHADHVGATVTARATDASHAVLTPAQLAAWQDRLRTGTVVVSAGDRLPPRRRRAAEARGLVVHHYYGAAELSFVAWGRDEADLRLFPGVEVDVRDGELWVRSRYLFSRYVGQPGPLRTGPEGWVTVGDRGRLDGSRVQVLGRPGTVTTAGATVALAEVEAVLREVTDGEVVVLGLPHPDLGSVLVAVLTEPADHRRLVEHARRLGAAARPRRWLHLADLPRTPGGKVDRAALEAALTSPDEDRPRTLR